MTPKPTPRPLVRSAVAAGLLTAVAAQAAEPAPAGKAVPAPSGMQEAFDLSVRQKRLRLELEGVEKLLAQAEKEQFAGFERVATPTGTDYSELLSDNVVYARATRDIRAGELLLYHAPGIYRVRDVRPKLTTKGECWYFRPDRAIAAGREFTIELIHDAPEEIANVAKGFAPHTDRARDPDRAYKTKIFTR